jgi:hypothetical protein
VPKGGKDVQVYPYEKHRKLRTRDKEDATLANQHKVPYCGVVGFTPLRKLTHFGEVLGCVFEQMHGVN